MGHRRIKKDMSLLGHAGNGVQDTVRAGIAPRPLPSTPTPDVPFDVPFGLPLAHVTRPPALSRVRGYLLSPVRRRGPLQGSPSGGENPEGWGLTGALTLWAWATASRLAPWMLNRRWFRRLTLTRAARHANRPTPAPMNVKLMDPAQLAKVQVNRGKDAGPLPALRWVDHRALAGMAPPPRVHEEHHATARHRRLFLTSLRRSGAHVTIDGDGTIHVE